MKIDELVDSGALAEQGIMNQAELDHLLLRTALADLKIPLRDRLDDLEGKLDHLTALTTALVTALVPLSIQAERKLLAQLPAELQGMLTYEKRETREGKEA